MRCENWNYTDNSDVTTWLYLETHESRKPKLNERIRKGRPICVQGYIREYRKDDNDSPTAPLSLMIIHWKDQAKARSNHRRAVQQLDTQRLIRRQTIERNNYIANEWYGWNSPSTTVSDVPQKLH